jgi:hypothetical protein
VHIRLVTLKRGLLVFWAVWFSLVCLTNVLDGCKRLALLPPTWQYVSGNFQLIVSVVRVSRMPEWLAALLFTGATFVEGVCAAIFWLAAVRFHGVKSPTLALAITAFAMSIALWAAFAVGVETFIAFEKVSEGTFHTLLSANLLSLLAICLLPDT